MVVECRNGIGGDAIEDHMGVMKDMGLIDVHRVYLSPR